MVHVPSWWSGVLSCVTRVWDVFAPGKLGWRHKKWLIASASACSAFALYLVYYVVYMVKRPSIVCVPTAQNARVLHRCASLTSRHFPSPWAPNGHVSTAYTQLRSLPRLPFVREEISLEDGGVVALDWLVDEHCGWAHPLPPHTTEGLDEEARESTQWGGGIAVLLCIHGLTGGSGSSYVRHCLSTCVQRFHRARGGESNGLIAVAMNMRGVAGTQLNTPKTYCAAYTEDLRVVIEHLHHRISARVGTNGRLYAVGFSLGANLLVKYLGEQHLEGRCSHITAAVSCSNPWDLHACTDRIQSSIVYDRVLTKGCVDSFQAIMDVFQPSADALGLDINRIVGAKSITEFDESFTRRVFGYARVEDYYSAGSSREFLESVGTPLLVLHAEDDPIVPPHGVPNGTTNECVIIARTHTGGHVGWPSGLLPWWGSSWADVAVCEYINAMEQEHMSGEAPQHKEQEDIHHHQVDGTHVHHNDATMMMMMRHRLRDGDAAGARPLDGMLIRHERPGDVARVARVLADAFGGAEEAALVRRLRDRDLIKFHWVAQVPHHGVVGSVVFTHVRVCRMGMEEQSGTQHGEKHHREEEEEENMEMKRANVHYDDDDVDGGGARCIGVGLGLAPLGVSPVVQSRGCGSSLLHHAIRHIHSIANGNGVETNGNGNGVEGESCGFIVVLGSPEYYGRFGFQPASRWGLHCAWDVPEEAFMAMELTPNALEGMEGCLVQYEREFEHV